MPKISGEIITNTNFSVSNLSQILMLYLSPWVMVSYKSSSSLLQLYKSRTCLFHILHSGVIGHGLWVRVMEKGSLGWVHGGKGQAAGVTSKLR